MPDELDARAGAVQQFRRLLQHALVSSLLDSSASPPIYEITGVYLFLLFGPSPDRA